MSRLLTRKALIVRPTAAWVATVCMSAAMAHAAENDLAAAIAGESPYGRGHEVAMTVAIQNTSDEEISVHVPASGGRNDLESYFRHHGEGRLVKIGEQGQRRPVESSFRLHKQIIDTSRRIALSPGGRIEFPVDLRHLFSLGLDESGAYSLALSLGPATAEYEFEIRPNSGLRLENTLEWADNGGVFRREYGVVARDPRQGGGFDLVQRGTDEAFKKIVSMDTRPMDLRALSIDNRAAATEGVLLLWFDETSVLWTIPPRLLWKTPLTLDQCRSFRVPEGFALGDLEFHADTGEERTVFRCVLDQKEGSEERELFLALERYEIHPSDREQFLDARYRSQSQPLPELRQPKPESPPSRVELSELEKVDLREQLLEKMRRETGLSDLE